MTKHFAAETDFVFVAGIGTSYKLTTEVIQIYRKTKNNPLNRKKKKKEVQRQALHGRIRTIN